MAATISAGFVMFFPQKRYEMINHNAKTVNPMYQRRRSRIN
jgi:hypothetical protein